MQEAEKRKDGFTKRVGKERWARWGGRNILRTAATLFLRLDERFQRDRDLKAIVFLTISSFFLPPRRPYFLSYSSSSHSSKSPSDSESLAESSFKRHASPPTSSGSLSPHTRRQTSPSPRGRAS